MNLLRQEPLENTPSQYGLESQWITAEGIRGVKYRYGDHVQQEVESAGSNSGGTLTIMKPGEQPRRSTRR
jgi:hypothetical protein